MPIEGNAQHAYTCNEGKIHAETALLSSRFPYSPQHYGNEDEDVNNKTCIERHVEGVYKQQLKPAAYLYDTRYDAVEHNGNKDKTTKQCFKATLDVRIVVALKIPYQHNSRQTE